MSGIFLSYRRVDTEAWAGRLFAELKRKPLRISISGIYGHGGVSSMRTRKKSTCGAIYRRYLTCAPK